MATGNMTTLTSRSTVVSVLLMVVTLVSLSRCENEWKMCSRVSSSTNADDTWIVPPSWTTDICDSFTTRTGHHEYGCFQSNNFTLWGSCNALGSNKSCYSAGVPSNVGYKTCVLSYLSTSGSYIANNDTITLATVNWSADTCRSWATHWKASQYRLGCLFNYQLGGMSISGVNGSNLPTPDCGWASTISRPQPQQLLPAIGKGQKLCISYVSDYWYYNSIVVPSTWTPQTCAEWAQTQNPILNCPPRFTTIYLACLFDDSFSVGGLGGGLPASNCGWAYPENERQWSTPLSSGTLLP